MTDMDTRGDLAAFANAGGQKGQPTGHSLVRPTTGLAERVIGAQEVAVHRDEQKVLQQLANLAAAAGSDFFYRFPVKKKDGGQDWIEGPSIKLANNVARIFGNNTTEIREVDVGDAWVFYARFTDIETGFSMERAYRQRKSQTSMRTRDADRQLDIAYQIGQSKAIRNVICNGLAVYCDYAFEEAQNSLVDKIGKDLQGWRTKTVDRLKQHGVEIARVERVIGRAAKDWLAPNIAQIIAMMKAVADGMASLDDTFPCDDNKASPAASGTHPEAATDDAAGKTGGEQGPTSASAAHDAARDSPAAADDNAAHLKLVEAFKAGQTAKSSGHKRTALPGELRDPKRSKEAIAWTSGWDGEKLPELKE